jgi:molybdopterin-guanine dinucleotide biosynthesis protein A
MKKYGSIQAFILGGGKSLRLNRDKAFLRYGDKYFIDIVIDCCASLFGSVHLVGKQYHHPELDGCMDDEIRGVGPLGGILTALKGTEADLNFFIGVDYPLISPEVVSYLADAALKQSEGGAMGLIPVMPDGPHPLFAFYSRTCLSAVRRCIDDRSYSVQCIAGHIHIHYLDLPKIEGDPCPAMLERNFVNINHFRDFLKLTRK